MTVGKGNSDDDDFGGTVAAATAQHLNSQTRHVRIRRAKYNTSRSGVKVMQAM
jgi:hypothetical protein